MLNILTQIKVPRQSRNCNKHGYLICLHSSGGGVRVWLWLCVRVCRFAPKMLTIWWWFLLNGLFKLFSHYFRNSLSFWCMTKTTRHVHTICSNSMMKHSVSCALLNIHITIGPNCFTIRLDPIYAQLHHPTRSHFFHRHSIIPDNKYVWNVYSLVQIFLCSEMTQNDALFVLLFFCFSSLVRSQSRHILNPTILITLSKHSI